MTAVLAGWEGPKKLMLRTDLEDPFASPEVQNVLERLLKQGYAVTPGGTSDQAAEGLILDLRTSATGTVLVLSRAGDGVVLALEKGGVERTPTTGPPVTKPETDGTVSSSPSLSTSVPEGAKKLPPGPLELSDRPRRIAFLGRSGDKIDLALLSDGGLSRVSLSSEGLLARSIYPAPLPDGRALHLDSGDLDGDGAPELTVVWAEDQRGIYEGTESKIHGWIFTEEGLKPLTPDLEGYLRIIGGRALFQRKGAYSLFSGPVKILVKEKSGYGVASHAVPWAQRDLYAVTPITAEEALVWNDQGKLALASLETGRTIPGGVLLEDLGEFEGPEVAVRLKNPEYRSGFSKEDRINETFVPLRRRMIRGADGSVYTLLRGRREGIPLLGKQAGSDSLVRIVRADGGLRLERPFAGVDAFILDFALVDAPKGPQQAVLLLNEKADGSGQAYLLFKHASERGMK